MRTLEFKASRAIELLREPIDAHTLREICGFTSEDKGDARHYRYTPDDLRRARLKLDGATEDRLIPLRADGLPGILVTRTSKGGTGKSSVTANLAATLAFSGYRVLVIDGDPQGSLTELFGVDTEDPDLKTLLNVLFQKLPLEEATIPIYANCQLDLLPADVILNDVDYALNAVPDRLRVFDKWLSANKASLVKYDIVLVDTNPGTTLLNFNLAVPAHMLMAVLALDGLSLKTMKNLKVSLYELAEARGSQSSPLTLIANMLDPSVKHIKDNYELLKTDERSSAYLNPVTIPKYAGFGRQCRVGGGAMPLVEAEPNTPAARRFIDLAQWVVEELR